MIQSLIKSILFIVALTSILSVALASHTKVKIGTVNAGGNGCANGEVSSYIDRATGQLIVEPYDYVTALENGSSVARKTCNFSIPVGVPANRAIRVRQYQVKGAVALDGSSTAQISLETFFAGQREEPVTITLSGNDNVLEFGFDETIPELEIVYSCGKDAIVRTNSSVLVRGGAETLVAFAQIQKLGLKIDSVPCSF
jgi:hypothetical protein